MAYDFLPFRIGTNSVTLSASPAQTFFPHFSLLFRRWHIQATCAFTGEGLLEAFSWLAERCRENEKLGLASVLYEGWS